MFTLARLRTFVQLSLEKTALESQVGIVNAAGVYQQSPKKN